MAIESAWCASDLDADHSWLLSADAELSAELREAIAQLKEAGKVAPRFTQEDFALVRLGDCLAQALKQAETGRGFAVLRGLVIRSYDFADLQNAIWGIGTYLGEAVPQDRSGGLFKRVSDEGDANVAPLHFHTDRCDILVLFYVRTAKVGGAVKLVSVGNVHREMKKREPRLARTLFDAFPQDRRGEEKSGEPPWMEIPILAIEDGLLIGRYNRRLIEASQRFPEAPRLSRVQREALDALDSILNEPDHVYEIQPLPGDLLLINNHLTWHARTAYTDDLSARRCALRLWISSKGSPRLPMSFKALFGSIEPGSIRGGVPRIEG